MEVNMDDSHSDKEASSEDTVFQVGEGIAEVILDDSSSTSFDKEKWTMSPDGSESKQNVCRKSTGSTQNMGRPISSPCPSSSSTAIGITKPKPTTVEDLKFMHNFDPQNSSRNQQKKKKRYHHNDGRLIQYADDYDLCDCLRPTCAGCHFPCPSCTDSRCGKECRLNRKWIYESVEIEGTNLEFRNPHYSTFT